MMTVDLDRGTVDLVPGPVLVVRTDIACPRVQVLREAPLGGTPVGGVTDHGALTGLSDPDHPISAVVGLQAALDGKVEASDLGAYPDATGQPVGKIAQTDGADGWSFIDTPSGGGTGGTSDHGSLSGLADDDHLQYHTDARGDARYYTKAQSDTALAGKEPSGAASAAITALKAEADPLTQYQKESERGAANGYAPLDATGKVPTANLPTADHSALTGRSAADQHPIGAITGLQPALDGKEAAGTAAARTPKIIVLGPAEAVPGGTPAGTVIVRRTV